MWSALPISQSTIGSTKAGLIFSSKTYQIMVSGGIESKKSAVLLASVDTRQEFGHFEADTVLSGKRKGQAVATTL